MNIILYSKKNNRLSSYNKRFIKDEPNPFSNTYLYNWLNIKSNYKNKSQIYLFKKILKKASFYI